MKFNVSKSDIVKAMSIVKPFCQKTVIIPILSNVKLTLDDGKLYIAASDSSSECITIIDVENIENGSTTVDCYKFFSAVSKLSGEVISITLDNEKLKVSNKKSTFLLSTISSDQFPLMQSVESESSFSINKNTFFTMINNTINFCEKDDRRISLGGVFMQCKDDNIFCVATDGAVLSCQQINAESNIPDIIIPRDVCNKILSSLSANQSHTVNIIASNNMLACDIGNTMIKSRLIDSTFPDWRRVVPSYTEKHVVCDACKLKDSLMLVKSLITKENKSIEIDIENDKMSVSFSALGNNFFEEIECISFTQRKIKVNTEKLLDILNCINGDFEMYFGDYIDLPIVIRDVSSSNVLYLIMPMR